MKEGKEMERKKERKRNEMVRERSKKRRRGRVKKGVYKVYVWLKDENDRNCFYR